uniref:DUF1822 family protein n=1 Tax=Oscillatoriales cyanobacterium SpSt-402 TaxID=2282168 RepID=A0A832M6S1_9CYAN
MLELDTFTQWLEIAPETQTTAWQQTEAIAIPGNRWQVYLNQVCLQTILPWLQEKFGMSAVASTMSHLRLWELVSGSIVTIGNTQLVLIPTEAMDRDEFRVPQEWIDIPNWAGEYYLAIEVDVDEHQLHIWGYTTHQMLKSQGIYDPNDRTYTLDEHEIIQDITAFWVMQQLRSEPTRSPVAELSPLAASQVNSLIQHLSQTAIAVPRLEIPFVQWGALLAQETWRNQLLEARSQSSQAFINNEEPLLPFANLSQWMQGVFEAGWRSLADWMGSEPDLAFSFRGDETDLEASIQRAKRISLGSAYPAVLLVLMLSTDLDGRQKIWIQLLPWIGESALPSNLELALLSVSGDVIQSVQSSEQSNYIQLRRFKCVSGTHFRVQIKMNTTLVIEEFNA